MKRQKKRVSSVTATLMPLCLLRPETTGPRNPQAVVGTLIGLSVCSKKQHASDNCGYPYMRQRPAQARKGAEIAKQGHKHKEGNSSADSAARLLPLALLLPMPLVLQA